MIPFFDFSVVEKIAVDAVKYKFVAMEVIHRIGAVRFGSLVSAISMYLLLQVQIRAHEMYPLMKTMRFMWNTHV